MPPAHFGSSLHGPPPWTNVTPMPRAAHKSSVTQCQLQKKCKKEGKSWKVHDWRQREPHVRHSWLITWNVLGYCKMLQLAWRAPKARFLAWQSLSSSSHSALLCSPVLSSPLLLSSPPDPLFHTPLYSLSFLIISDLWKQQCKIKWRRQACFGSFSYPLDLLLRLESPSPAIS